MLTKSETIGHKPIETRIESQNLNAMDSLIRITNEIKQLSYSLDFLNCIKTKSES